MPGASHLSRHIDKCVQNTCTHYHTSPGDKEHCLFSQSQSNPHIIVSRDSESQNQMLALFLIVLAAADASFGLSCITNCSIEKIPFDQELRIPDGQCQQRDLLPSCNIDVRLNYETRTYNVSFPDTTAPRDTISISSKGALIYNIARQCSDDTDCILTETRKEIRALTRRSYNATAIYEQIASVITSAAPITNPIRCFNMSNGTETCASRQICGVEYNQLEQSIRSRGCTSNDVIQVFVYDSPTYTWFIINCNRDFCNGDETYDQIKSILIKNNLVDANGRIPAIAGSPSVVPSLFLIFSAVLFILF